MIVVLSGEGAADIGACTNQQGLCSGCDFLPGPMTVLIDQALEQKIGYSILDYPDRLHFVGEAELCRRMRQLPVRMQPARSKKRGKETGYFFGNAVALGAVAQEIEKAAQSKAVAVLFRDCDRTHSAKAGLWETMRASIEHGFAYSGFARGVPMLPKPKSEAWLLCIACPPAAGDCSSYEELSGNDSSPNAPKKKLDAAFGRHLSGPELCDWLKEDPFDVARMMSMPSFRVFKERLDCAADEVLH